MRSLRLIAVAGVVALSLTVVPFAGAGAQLGDFTIQPTQGVAGQQVQITASDEGPGCVDFNSRSSTQGFGPVLGTTLTQVVVTLWTPGKGSKLDEETAINDFVNGWQVQLTMPSGQPAGEYPISATCHTNGFGQVTGAYTDQIFVLVAPTERADPVEAEVTLTG